MNPIQFHTFSSVQFTYRIYVSYNKNYDGCANA